jgi:uncharacterized membrane protein
MGLAVALIYAMGSVVCHQMPDRSFFVAGHQLPVCARCTGLYVSGAVAIVAWWMARWARGAAPLPITPPLALRAVAIAALPTAISWTSGVIGAWDGTNMTRALLAVPLGLTAGAVVAAVSTKDLR